ncbi:MAG: hypothetical protein A3G20_07305 [Acidobacteria bacterium RIFCSPLOWO2_12_FULL_59_11]|nr:MAG: hypothetical protein A3G20_07305 [Acidobacteria bacterium RIFCSPLOWO2_12_FULL_59_11]
MDTQTQSVLLFLAVVITVVLIVQTVLLLVLVLTFRKWCDRTNQLIGEVNRNIEPVTRAARDLLVESREKLQVISTNLVEITQQVKNQAHRLDSMLTDASDRAHLQLIRLDQLLSNTLARVEETTEVIQHSILVPVRELSAVLAGVRTALDFLFRRNKSGMERATQDEELFI